MHLFSIVIFLYFYRNGIVTNMAERNKDEDIFNLNCFT